MVASLRKQLKLKTELKLIIAQSIDFESKYRKHWDI